MILQNSIKSNIPPFPPSKGGDLGKIPFKGGSISESPPLKGDLGGCPAAEIAKDGIEYIVKQNNTKNCRKKKR